jgi:hypothetical protein
MRIATTITILALGLAAGGCSTVEMKQVSMQPLRNAEGHVIGQKETLCDCRNGERISRVALFEPRYDGHGALVGYQERIPGGVVLRDLNGRRIGSRYIDLRSRATNAQNQGLTIIVYSQPAARPPVATGIDELVKIAGLAPQIR